MLRIVLVSLAFLVLLPEVIARPGGGSSPRSSSRPSTTHTPSSHSDGGNHSGSAKTGATATPSGRTPSTYHPSPSSSTSAGKSSGAFRTNPSSNSGGRKYTFDPKSNWTPPPSPKKNLSPAVGSNYKVSTWKPAHPSELPTASQSPLPRPRLLQTAERVPTHFQFSPGYANHYQPSRSTPLMHNIYRWYFWSQVLFPDHSHSNFSYGADTTLSSVSNEQMHSNMQFAKEAVPHFADENISESHSVRKGEMRIVDGPHLVRLIAPSRRQDMALFDRSACFIDKEGVVEVLGFHDAEHAIGIYLRDSRLPSECPSGSTFVIPTLTMASFPMLVEKAEDVSKTPDSLASDTSPSVAMAEAEELVPEQQHLTRLLDRNSTPQSRMEAMNSIGESKLTPEIIKSYLCLLVDDADNGLTPTALEKLLHLPSEKFTPTVVQNLLMAGVQSDHPEIRIAIFEKINQDEPGLKVKPKSLKFRTFVHEGLNDEDDTVRRLAQSISDKMVSQIEAEKTLETNAE